MNKKQWYILSITSYLLAGLMMHTSLQWKGICSLEEVRMTAIVICLKGEIFAPFPYLLIGFATAFLICGILHKKDEVKIVFEK